MRQPQFRHAGDHQGIGIVEEKDSQAADREEQDKRHRSADLFTIKRH